MGRPQEPPEPTPSGSAAGQPRDPSANPMPESDLWQRTVDAMDDLIAILDDRHHIVRANKALADRLGITLAKCVGQTCTACFHQTNEVPDDCPHTKVLRDGKRHGTEIHDKRLGGNFQVALSPLTDADGKVVGSVFLAHDINRRKRTEEALWVKDAAVESSLNAITLADLSGRLTYVNRSFLDLWGYEDDREVLGRTAPTFWQSSSQASAVMDAALSGKGWRGRLTARKKDGSSFEVHLSASLVRDPAGKGFCVMGSFVDVTERSRAETALRDSERRYRTLFEDVPVGIYRTSPGGRVLSANRALLDMLGFDSLEELAQRDLEREGFAPETPRSQFTEAIERDGKVEGIENVWIRRDGTEVLVRENAVAVRDEDGRSLYYEGMAEDITESRRAQREAAQLRTLAHNANYGVAVADLDGYLTYTNPYFAQVHGYEPEELLGKSLDILHTPEQRRRVTELTFALQHAGSFSAEVVWHRRRDGSAFPMLMNGVLIRDAEGRGQFMAATAVDVTEREQAQRALRVAHRMLLNAREDERRRLARELHDSIGQELVAMKMAFQIVGSDRADARLAALGEQCARLIKEVRDICHGLYPATLESLGLAAALRELERSCGSAVDFSVDCDAALAQPCLDPQQRIVLFRIAQEAVSNALRHGGARKIAVSLKRQRREVRMTVMDDGRGFDVGNAATRGLGLRTMQDRANAIGGAVRVTSGPGGTRVAVRAPVDDSGPAASDTPADLGYEVPADAWSSGLWDW